MSVSAAGTRDALRAPGRNRVRKCSLTPYDVTLSEVRVKGTLEDALQDVRAINNRGLGCSLSYLPTLSASTQDVEEHVQEYLRAMAAIHEQKLNADVTVKMPQLGIYADGSLAESSSLRIAQTAQAFGLFVWIDMERPETVDETLRIYARARKLYGCVGICLQAYLTRTTRDLDRVLAEGGIVRLVKGFYRFHDISRWQDVTRNYRMLMLRVLRESPRPAIATHDRNLVEEAKQFIRDNRIDSAEFQFFKGASDSLADQLRKEGFNVRIYLPYGKVLRYWADGIWTFDLRRQFQRIIGMTPTP